MEFGQAAKCGNGTAGKRCSSKLRWQHKNNSGKINNSISERAQVIDCLPDSLHQPLLLCPVPTPIFPLFSPFHATLSKRSGSSDNYM